MNESARRTSSHINKSPISVMLDGIPCKLNSSPSAEAREPFTERISIAISPGSTVLPFARRALPTSSDIFSAIARAWARAVLSSSLTVASASSSSSVDDGSADGFSTMCISGIIPTGVSPSRYCFEKTSRSSFL